MTERFTTLSSPPLHSGSVLRRYHEVKSPLFQLSLHHNNARFQYICRFQRVEVPTRFCGEEVMRGRRVYGGGSGFLLCFAAERKHCAPESLFQLPLPSHTLLREKVAVRPDFLNCLALCTALLSARSAMPCARKFAAVLLTVPCAFRKERPPKVDSHLKSAAFLCALSGKPPPARDRVTA